jgi:hypothetical protein
MAIFTSQEAAAHAAARLGSLGIPREQMHFLMPGAPAAALEEVPTTETEQPGMGAALGSVVGGAVGASGGLMSAAVLSAIIPYWSGDGDRLGALSPERSVACWRCRGWWTAFVDAKSSFIRVLNQ